MIHGASQRRPHPRGKPPVAAPLFPPNQRPPGQRGSCKTPNELKALQSLKRVSKLHRSSSLSPHLGATEQNDCTQVQCERKFPLVSQPGDHICLQLQDVSLLRTPMACAGKQKGKKEGKGIKSLAIFDLYFFLLGFFTISTLTCH